MLDVDMVIVNICLVMQFLKSVCVRERVFVSIESGKLTSSIWECGTWGFTPCGWRVVRFTGAVVSILMVGLWRAKRQYDRDGAG